MDLIYLNPFIKYIKNINFIQLYWDIGKSIIEKQQQTRWGKSVVENLAKDLQAEFPDISGFSATNLWYMSQFYMEYQGKERLRKKGFIVFDLEDM